MPKLNKSRRLVSPSMASEIKKNRKQREKAKEPRKANFRKKIFNGDQATKISSFSKRKPTLKKKAQELKTLCDLDVCMICYGPDGSLDFWPQQPTEVANMCMSYLKLDDKGKKEWSYLDILQDKKKKLLKKKEKATQEKIDEVVSSVSKWLDGLSGNSFADSVIELETRIKSFKQRIELLSEEANRKKTTQVDEISINNSLLNPSHLGVWDQNKNNNNCYGSYSSFNFGHLGGNYMNGFGNEFGFKYEEMDRIREESNFEKRKGGEKMSNYYEGVPISVWEPSQLLNLL